MNEEHHERVSFSLKVLEWLKQQRVQAQAQMAIDDEQK
jgi:hypothetical protein